MATVEPSTATGHIVAQRTKVPSIPENQKFKPHLKKNPIRFGGISLILRL